METELPLKLDRSNSFVNAVFRVLEGSSSEREAVSLLLDAESLSEVKLLTKEPSKPQEPIPVESYQEMVEPRMNQFLTRTQLVFGSYEYKHLYVVIADDYNYSWTEREWGQMLAGWANKTQWLGRLDWNYLDLYGGLNDRVVENYNSWIEVAMRVVEMKSNLGT